MEVGNRSNGEGAIEQQQTSVKCGAVDMAKRKSAAAASEAAQSGAAQGYTVLARRYRPQQFKELVGQEPVARALVNALESNRVAHAYLFTGARGVGKTSTARILAKALNCVKGPTPTPCDECENCKSIAVGEDVDVLEIDGASNRGIDEVREIRQNVQFRPSRGRFKIYIIDEVHMLTAPAFNALLKTLEEPPAHVKFIFATTEVQRIPVTILSRCQRFDFAGIGTARIVERLKQVVAAEHGKAADDALELIARRAAGSMRDAQSLLDQLLAFGSESSAGLSAEQVHHLLGTADDDHIAELAAAIVEREPQRALELLGQAADEGVNLGEILDQLIDYWRDLMVVHCAGAQAPGLSVPARHREALGKQAAALSVDAILAGLDILAATKARLRGSNHGRVLVEMAVVRLGRLENLVSLSQLADALSQREAAPALQAAKSKVTVSGPAATEASDGGKKKVDSPVETGLTQLSAETIPMVWSELLKQVGGFLANHLQNADLPAISGPNSLVLRFQPQYNQDRQYCQERLARAEEVLRKIAGPAWHLRIEGGADAVEQPTAVAEAENSQSRYRRQRAEIGQAPLIKRAVDLLGAQILHVDEGFGAQPETTPQPQPAGET